MSCLRITAPHFVAGIADGRAAPIVQYMKDWSPRQIKEYCDSKGWFLEQLQEKGTMAQSTVVIEVVKPRQTQWGTMYSVKGNDGEWYSAGKIRPPEEGSYVEITWEVDAKGYKKVKSFNRLQGQAPTQNVAKGALLGSKNLTKDDYWNRREERDIQTQARIELQSCRNSALELVKLMLQADALPVPTKKADREAFLAEAVEHYTQEFLKANAGHGQAEAQQEEPRQQEDDAVFDDGDNSEEWN